MVETTVAVEWKTDEAWVESGRVGSGRVNAALYPTRPKPHSFFGPPWLYRCALRFPS